MLLSFMAVFKKMQTSLITATLLSAFLAACPRASITVHKACETQDDCDNGQRCIDAVCTQEVQPKDAGTLDVPVLDGATWDAAGQLDAGLDDLRSSDRNFSDSSFADLQQRDAAQADTNSADVNFPDATAQDTNSADVNFPDATAPDQTAPDQMSGDTDSQDAGTNEGATVVGHVHTDLTLIPDTWITQAKQNLHIAYNHTSHGSQVITGLRALRDFPAFGSKYNWSDTSQGNEDSLSLDDMGIPGISDLSQGDADSDNDGIDNWAEDTYTFLTDSDNYHINVIMWSWCNISGHDIPRYLNSMEWLIAQFSVGGSHARAAEHPVQFVFMTAHANGGGENDSSDSANKLIRAHVLAHDRILFDFSDIENYDPDNNYFLDKLLTDDLDYDSDNNGSKDSNWAHEYLARHDDGELDQLTHGDGVDNYDGAGSCAHSDGTDNDPRLNCVLKGRGVWYLFARLAGWNG